MEIQNILSDAVIKKQVRAVFSKFMSAISKQLSICQFAFPTANVNSMLSRMEFFQDVTDEG